MTTNQPTQGPTIVNAVTGTIGFIVYLWLAWMALGMYVAMWMYYPVVAVLLTALAAYLIARRLRSMQLRRQAYADRAFAGKHAYYRAEEVRRAQSHPDLVFDEHAESWEREMSA